MTIKQCESCKYHHINIKTKEEGCWLVCGRFMRSVDCIFYKQGNFEEIREEHLNKNLSINRYLRGIMND